MHPGLPSKHRIAKPLLQAEYQAATNYTNQRLNQAKYLTLMTDGWTNTHGEGILNFVLATPKPVFHSAVVLSDEKENAKFVAQKITDVIEKVGPSKVQLVTVDNARVMTAACNIVRTKYPHILSIGCGAHGLNLSARDLVKIKDFSDIRKRAVEVVKIKRKRVPLAVFRSKQNKETPQNGRPVTLKLPNPTRFAGDSIMLESLLKNKAALKKTAIDEKVTLPTSVLSAIIDEDGFWKNVSNLSALLEPIARGIEILEGDQATLSLLVAILMDIKNVFLNVLPKMSLSSVTQKTVLETLNKRVVFCCKPIHLAAYLVDPRFQGKGLSDQQCLKAIEVIVKIARHQNLDQGPIIANLGQFRCQSGIFAETLLHEAAQRNEPESECKPVEWWQGFCAQQPLCPVAVTLLTREHI